MTDCFALVADLVPFWDVLAAVSPENAHPDQATHSSSCKNLVQLIALTQFCLHTLTKPSHGTWDICGGYHPVPCLTDLAIHLDHLKQNRKKYLPSLSFLADTAEQFTALLRKKRERLCFCCADPNYSITSCPNDEQSLRPQTCLRELLYFSLHPQWVCCKQIMHLENVTTLSALTLEPQPASQIKPQHSSSICHCVL